MSTIDAATLDVAVHGTPSAGAVELHDALASTVDRCRELAESGAPEGATVIAREQLAGRGQRGNQWFSPRDGALYMSVLLRAPLPPEEVALVSTMFALAVHDGLATLGAASFLKRPNDLVIQLDGSWRKIGGMLLDAAIQGKQVRHVVASVGVNLSVRRDDFPESLRATAASLCDVVEPTPSTADVAGAILRALWTLRAQVPTGVAGWSERHASLLRDVIPGESVAVGGTACRS
jgi:BirA family biotin operon repressor/biotin-[acetyl-CoA-carboxylase] ligase